MQLIHKLYNGAPGQMQWELRPDVAGNRGQMLQRPNEVTQTASSMSLLMCKTGRLSMLPEFQQRLHHRPAMGR